MDPLTATARRAFLAGGLGAVAVAAFGASLEAGQSSDTERANVSLVNDFCGAFASHDIGRISSCLADNAVWRPDNGVLTTTAPAVGRDAIVARISRFLDRVVEFRVVQTFATGSVVLNERYDRFNPERTLHLAGVFFIRDGKIVEWTDYL